MSNYEKNFQGKISEALPPCSDDTIPESLLQCFQKMHHVAQDQ